MHWSSERPLAGATKVSGRDATIREFGELSGKTRHKKYNKKGKAIRMEKKPKTQEEILKGIRRDWGNVKPFTRKFPDKTKYNRKRKHKSDSKTDCSFS